MKLVNYDFVNVSIQNYFKCYLTLNFVNKQTAHDQLQNIGHLISAERTALDI